MPIGVQRKNAWQKQIQFYLRAAWKQEPLTGPVTLDCLFMLSWPQSAPQRDPKAIQRWDDKHIIKKPDGDNYFKAFADSGQGILYLNDSQITRWSGEKQYLNPNIYNDCREGYTEMRLRWTDD